MSQFWWQECFVCGRQPNWSDQLGYFYTRPQLFDYEIHLKVLEIYYHNYILVDTPKASKFRNHIYLPSDGVNSYRFRGVCARLEQHCPVCAIQLHNLNVSVRVHVVSEIEAF